MYEDYVKAKETEVDIPEFLQRQQYQQRPTETIYIIKNNKKRSGTKGKSSLKFDFDSKKEQRKLKEHFDNLQGTGSKLIESLNVIVKTNTLILGGVLLAGALLMGCKKLLESSENGGLFGSKGKDDYEYTPSGRSSGKLSAKGKEKLIEEEGCKLYAYQDTNKKIWTIGVGHTGQVDGKPIARGMKITKQKAEELFDKDVEKFEKYVNSVVKVPVSQNMFDAMVSYAFNVGYLGPNFLQKLNSGDYTGAMRELTTINPELEKRRQREQQLFGIDIGTNNKLMAPEINPVSDVTTVGTTTSAGNLTRMYNKTKVGGYEMHNTVYHDGKLFIDLSERAEAYLKDVGGQGMITSGAEGDHIAKGKIMTHEAGNKVDVIPLLGHTTDEDWANLAIPFIKNKNTAFVNFEDFSQPRFNKIKQIIFSKLDASMRAKCQTKVNYVGQGLTSIQPFLFRSHTGGGLHLDIGIKPNSYVNIPKDELNGPKVNEVKEVKKEDKAKQQTKTTKTTDTKKVVNVGNTSTKTKGQQKSLTDVGAVDPKALYANSQGKVSSKKS